MTWFVQILGTRASRIAPVVERLGCRVQRIEDPEQLDPAADIALAAGVHYILKPRFLKIPRLGIWGFHETRLPEGRGCAPLQWTVLNGTRELTVSFFELARKFDTGRLLGQASATIPRTALLDEIQGLAMELTEQLITTSLLPFLDGRTTPHAQEEEGATYHRKRTPEDSRLVLDRSLREQWGLLRVCDNDRFPAWFEIDGRRFIVKVFRAPDD